MINLLFTLILLQFSRALFVKNLQTGTKALTFIVSYLVDVKTKQHLISCACKKTEVVNLTAVTPFEVSVKLMSMKVRRAKFHHRLNLMRQSQQKSSAFLVC